MRFNHKALLRIVILALLVGLIVGYVLMCLFFLVISWVAQDYTFGCIGWGMAAAPAFALSIFGK